MNLKESHESASKRAKAAKAAALKRRSKLIGEAATKRGWIHQSEYRPDYAAIDSKRRVRESRGTGYGHVRMNDYGKWEKVD